MTLQAFKLADHFLSLDGDGRVAHHDGGAHFWSTIATRTDVLGTLVSFGDSDADWTTWEMHPDGDEILFLAEGEVTMILERPGGDERVRMTTHDSFVVPAGTWHRALIHAPSKMLFMTFGAGTRHKPVVA